MSPVYLDRWCVRRDNGGNPYLAPEQGRIYLSGVVTGHPHKPDGSAVDTSHIVSVKQRVVTTRSGTVYRLGRPDPKWLAWMRKSGITYDPKQPIRVLE